MFYFKVAEERISNIRTVKAFAQEPREMERYKDTIANILQLGYQESKARAIFYGMACYINVRNYSAYLHIYL